MRKNAKRDEGSIKMTIILSTFERPRGRKVVLQVADQAEADRLSRDSRLFLEQFRELELPWERVNSLFRRPEQRARIIAGLRPPERKPRA